MMGDPLTLFVIFFGIGAMGNGLQLTLLSKPEIIDDDLQYRAGKERLAYRRVQNHKFRVPEPDITDRHCKNPKFEDLALLTFRNSETPTISKHANPKSVREKIKK